jgi:TRAP-type C4-dicarboxylate transport system permease small subunit
MLDRLLDKATRMSQWLVWVGGAMLVFAACFTTVDVVLRKLISFSFGGADEIAGYLFAVSTAFAYAFLVLNRGNVRIDALYLVLPRIVRLTLDVVGFLMLAGLMVFMAERSFNVYSNSWENSSVSITPLVTPLALPQGFWFAGLIFAIAIVLLIFVRLVVAILQGDSARITQLVGARGLEEEIAEEKARAEADLARERRLVEKGGD